MTVAPEISGHAAGEKLEQAVVKRWFADRGDQTLRITYPLTRESVVLDVGGYEGNWAAQIHALYGCTIHIFEPVPQFAKGIEERFAGAGNVHVHRYGLSDQTGKMQISINNDGSSVHKAKGTLIDIELRSAEEVFGELGLSRGGVDLMKINIEGCEYELLGHLIETKLIESIRDVQVQFHDFVPDAAARMGQLQAELGATHDLKWQYRFVWENWTRKKGVGSEEKKLSSRWLLDQAKNVHSQSGEDGILAAIFGRVPLSVGGRWCVEFGAWDGKKCSNTCNLVMDFDWSGVFIEGNEKKFAECVKTYAERPKAICMHEWVTFEGEGSLDSHLAKTAIPLEFDLLSIDIDGNDYHIWDSVKKYRPKVVVIEFNPSIPHNISFIQARDMEVRQGSSLKALNELGETKGYRLICVTELNAIFVRAELFGLFGIEDNSLDMLHQDTQYITQVFQLYDGTLVWEGCKQLLWHGVPIKPEKMQVLPKELRFLHDPEMSAEQKKLVQGELSKYR